MATLTFDHRLKPAGTQLIAGLHRKWVATDGFDLHSIDSPLPTDDQVAADLAGADAVVVARDRDLIRGYGRLLSWTETDGTRVHLLDTHSAPGPGRPAVDEGLLTHLEKQVAQHDTHPTMVAANAEIGDLDRTAVLEQLGYKLCFEMVELELGLRHTRGSVPPGVAIRPAQPADAASVAHLTEENWAGRLYFDGLSAKRTAAWLEKSDPELFLLAEAAGQLIGIAVAKISDRVVEIDDLGVLPTWRRRGPCHGTDDRATRPHQHPQYASGSASDRGVRPVRGPHSVRTTRIHHGSPPWSVPQTPALTMTAVRCPTDVPQPTNDQAHDQAQVLLHKRIDHRSSFAPGTRVVGRASFVVG